jgi:hypothetical protein
LLRAVGMLFPNAVHRISHFQPSGYYMYHQFNISAILRSANTVY